MSGAEFRASTGDSAQVRCPDAGSVPDPVKVAFIVGPTGVGKSEFALEAAGGLGAEIVNGDSRQVYRGMDIGTAKPTFAERRRIPHHLVDVRAPDDPLDAAAFADLARAEIAQIAARGRPVLVVGGSGLYLRALRGGIFTGAPASPELRRELASLAAHKGSVYLHERLGDVDPMSARRIMPADLQRIVRALEVYRLTGVPLSEHHARHRFAAGEYTTLLIALTLPRTELYERINQRFEAMLEAGLADEVRRLIAAGHGPGQAPLRVIGYKQIAAYLAGEMPLYRAVELAKRDTRRLAKRQMTWFRHEPGVVWLDVRRQRGQAFAMLSEFFNPKNASSPYGG